MLANTDRYKVIVLTRRIKMLGIVETMSEQVPEVKIAFSEIDEMLRERMEDLGADQWRILSHSHNIHNGILVVSILLESTMATPASPQA
jgi:hypothetical protein